MAVLAQPLGQDRAEGAVGIDHQHPMGLDGLGRGCALGQLDDHRDKLMVIGGPNAYQAMPCHLARGIAVATGSTKRQNGIWVPSSMTALQHPEAIRHFQSLCDACQELAHRYHSPAEMRLYADGYLHALRRTTILDPIQQRRLEELVDRWIMDPSSFVGPDGDPRTLYETGRS
jgi:hypothetical protein